MYIEVAKFVYDGLGPNANRAIANAAMLAQQQKRNTDEALHLHSTEKGPTNAYVVII